MLDFNLWQSLKYKNYTMDKYLAYGYSFIGSANWKCMVNIMRFEKIMQMMFLPNRDAPFLN
jgi:hypothetical protein